MKRHTFKPPATKMNIRDRRLLLPAALVALAVLLWLIFSPWGGISYFSRRRQLTDLQAGNRKLTENNQSLAQEIDKLKHDKAYLEKVAREQYGLLRKNEIIYEYPTKKPAKH